MKKWGKDGNMETLMKAGMLTLDQLIDDEDKFLTYAVLRDKYHPSDVTQRQYLQL